MSRIKVIATLEHRGELRDWLDHWDGRTDDAHIYFMWTEGNFGCDCNRALFFSGYQAECPCGDTEYKLVSLTADGRQLLDP